LGYPDLCVIFDCDNRGSVETEALALDRVQRLFEGRADVKVVRHIDHRVASPDLPRAHLALSTTDIMQATPHRKGEAPFPGNLDLKLIAAADRIQGYRFLARIEADVWVGQAAARKVDAFCKAACSGAVGAAFIRPQAADVEWSWWSSLIPPPDVSVDPHAAFLPVCFMPVAFLAQYRDALRDGWAGHYEVLMPTLARYHGHSLLELGRTGLQVVKLQNFRALRSEWEEGEAGAFMHPVKRLADLPWT